MFGTALLAQTSKKVKGNNMKIALISEHYPPSSGGVATSTQRISRALVKHNVDVQVLSFDHSRPIEGDDYIVREEDEGVSVAKIGPFFLKHKKYPVDHISEKIRASFRRRAFGQMINILEKMNTKADIVLSLYLLNAGYLGLFVARYFDLPFVAGVRGNDIGRNIFHVERFGVINWVIEGANKIVCVNSHLLNRMLLAFPNVKHKSVIINNAVSQVKPNLNKKDARDKVLQKCGWYNGDLVLAFIGTLREKKGVVTLLKALDRLKEKIDVKLLIIGPEIGSVEKHMVGDIWENLKSIGSIYVTGQISREKVKDLAIGCDLVVMPSLDDGLANGLLEGMSVGLCPIVSNVFTDVVMPGKNGYIFTAGDCDSLCECIYNASKNKNKILQMGLCAKADSTKYNVDKESSAYISLFESLLRNR